MKSALKNKHEHITCSKFQTKEEAPFLFEESNIKNQILQSNSCKKNLLIFITTGEISIKSPYFNHKVISEGTMFAICKDMPYTITCKRKTKMLFFYFDSPSSSCIKQIMHSYRKHEQNSLCKGYVLPIKEPIADFIKLLSVYLSAGASCLHLHELKQEELFLTLRWFYDKEELELLLYPILKHNNSFRRFVLENCEKVNNVTEMIEYSNLSKSVFYEKFKKEFGISAKRWMTERLKQKILRRIATSDISAKKLMTEFNFSSPEHLNRFCKKQFEMTPSELIRTHKA